MANTDVYNAVERIRTDADFARRVAEEGAAALTPFHLDSDEQTAIVLAFQRDLDAELGEVVGFTGLNFGGLQFTNLVSLQDVPAPKQPKGGTFLELEGIKGESKDG